MVRGFEGVSWSPWNPSPHQPTYDCRPTQPLGQRGVFFFHSGICSNSSARIIYLHLEKRICDSFRIARNGIVVTVFLMIMKQSEFRLVHNQKDPIPCNSKGNYSIVVGDLTRLGQGKNDPEKIITSNQIMTLNGIHGFVRHGICEVLPRRAGDRGADSTLTTEEVTRAAPRRFHDEHWHSMTNSVCHSMSLFNSKQFQT